MYECMYVYMYVCMFVYSYMYMNIHVDILDSDKSCSSEVDMHTS